MKTRWILIFFVISLFFISGQAGCDIYTPPGGVPGGQPSTGAKGRGGLSVNVEPIGVLYEDEEFDIYIDVINTGKEVDVDIKLWDINRNLGAIPDEEFSVFLEDARVGDYIEGKTELITLGPHMYSDLIADINTNLIMDVNADYSVSITPSKGICVAKRDSRLCNPSETISGANLGDEAAAVPITVTGIQKTYRSTEDVVNLHLDISLSDVGQGAGLNDYVNNFDVGFADGGSLKCSPSGTINIKQLKEPIRCNAKIDLAEEALSEQITISFDYNYLIRQTIPITIKANKEEII